MSSLSLPAPLIILSEHQKKKKKPNFNIEPLGRRHSSAHINPFSLKILRDIPLMYEETRAWGMPQLGDGLLDNPENLDATTSTHF